MDRDVALEKIAWHKVKRLSRDEAVELIIRFFNEPLKPSLREKLNITAVLQWETHEPPSEIKPGNSIYRPILIEKMKRPFKGATNEYLVEYLISTVGVEVNAVEGQLPSWLPCPVCQYHTFEIVGDWDTCVVCGWNSDPVQEAMPDDPTGANGISLNDARKNFEIMGAISQAKSVNLDLEAKRRYPRSG